MKKKSKFRLSIIEIILIIAILGLVLLVVFVALPLLQRSQDDTTRRDDITKVYRALVQYQTDNSASKDNLPQQGSWMAPADGSFGDGDCDSNSACKFARDYINSGATEEVAANSFIAPDDTPYSIIITGNYSDGILSYNAIDDYESDRLVSSKEGITIQSEDASSHHVIFIVPGGKCDGETVKKSNKRRFAILYHLEEAGVYCLDDQQ